MKRVSKCMLAILCLTLWAGAPAFGQDAALGLSADDLRIELRADGGFHLFIRKKPGINSVLLTESTRDPTMQEDNFAYRAREWNPVNGDEVRLLNGAPISPALGRFFLISSTPVAYPPLGEAFHVYIPWVLEYGQENTRNGEVHVGEGTYFNVRSFALPYADYRGNFSDNPFVLQALQPASEDLPLGHFSPEGIAAFSEIAREGGGEFLSAPDPATMIEMIESILRKESGKSVDIVLCLDTTGSMGPYLNEIRAKLIPMMRGIIADYTDWRIGMVLYRDYPPDLYLTRNIPFTRDFNSFQRNLNAARAQGGGDIPEAVYEALYEGADKFSWAAESRLLILMGDAPPHPEPRRRITKEMVYEKATEKDIKISAIILGL